MPILTPATTPKSTPPGSPMPPTDPPAPSPLERLRALENSKFKHARLLHRQHALLEEQAEQLKALSIQVQLLQKTSAHVAEGKVGTMKSGAEKLWAPEFVMKFPAIWDADFFENLEPMFRTMWCFFMVALLLVLPGIVPLEDLEYLMHRTMFWFRDLGRAVYAMLPGR